MDILNTNLMDNENSDLLNVNYYEKTYGASGDSEGEAEGESESENEDYIEGEGEESEIGDTSDTDLPKFRTLVRNKKLEFKAQYGKAHIENHSTTERQCKTIQVPKVEMISQEECINVPYTHWDSNINCSSVCVKWNYKLECTERKTGCLGGFVGGTRRECKTIQVPKITMIDQEECINVPKIRFVWVSGWRKKWREFKRNGGLAQLKLQSKGLLPLDTSVTPTDLSTPTPTVIPDSQLTCQELADKYKIIAGQSWGTAPTSVINDWVKRDCRIPTSTTLVDETTETNTDNEGGDKPKKKTKTSKVNKTITEDKILGMPKDIAIGLGVAVALISGFIVYKKFVAKN